MPINPPHQALRYLLRASGTPEVSTNNALQAVLDSDPAVAVGFLAGLGQLSGHDLSGCRINREAHDVDAVTEKRSFRDFLLSRAGRPVAIIETKVDAALTSSDQAQRYFDQLDDGGLLVLVTRKPLLRALGRQAESQLGMDLPNDGRLLRGVREGRTVLVLSWNDLLHAPVNPGGEPFPDLVALAAAIEDITEFVPFGELIQDIAVGRTVAQVTQVARTFCRELPARLDREQVCHEVVTGRTKESGTDVYVVLAVLKHRFWVGYDANYWAKVPGDPERKDTRHATVAPPSPFWVNRYFGDRLGEVLAEEQRGRLDELGIAHALQAPLGEPEHAVVEALLDQAVRHIGRISAQLHTDPAASANLPASSHSAGCLRPVH